VDGRVFSDPVKTWARGFIFTVPNIFSTVNVLYTDLVTSSFFWQGDEGDNLLSSAI